MLDNATYTDTADPTSMLPDEEVELNYGADPNARPPIPEGIYWVNLSLGKGHQGKENPSLDKTRPNKDGSTRNT